MEFDSPEVAREFPGLYKKPEGDGEMNDHVDYDEEGDKKKKKEKKEKKLYAALADENSQDEEEEDPQHGKKKLKGFLSSAKKKDKDKEKDKKGEKDKDKKKGDVSLGERKSSEKEVPVAGHSQTPFSNIRIPFSVERHRDINAHRASVPAAFFTSTPKAKEKETRESPQTEKEKSSSSALNAFLNAPAPLFLQRKKDKDKDKDKEHKKEKKEKKEKSKDKECKEKDKKEKKEKEPKEKEKKEKDKEKHASGVAKVKLKLMRSKNSLEDPHDKSDLHVSVSHQFPEDPETISKEIRRYEQLLEQTHAHIKSSKKVSKKHEEQLWELQRTLTALKRKLRSINVLSTASVSGIGHKCDEEAHQESSGSLTNPHPSISPVERISAAITQEGCEKSNTRESPLKEGDIISSIDNDITNKSPSSAPPEEKEKHNEIIPVIEAPPRKSARRSLDFSEVEVEKKPITVEESRIPVSVSQEGFPLEGIQPLPEEEPHKEHEKVEVQVLVHQESKEEEDEEIEDDDSSIARSEEDVAVSVSSRNEENIGNVVNDANAMIGSMHEELEAAALVFGRKIHAGHILKGGATIVSKSEPTFGEQPNDSSDIELIRDDEEDDVNSFIEDLIPEIMTLPEFETSEYYLYENEQLVTFNAMLEEDVKKEEADLEELILQFDALKTTAAGSETLHSENCDMDKLISHWKAAKLENEALHANIARLKQMVTLSKLEEFRLETRLRYLEDKVIPISPITTTTPLHFEA